MSTSFLIESELRRWIQKLGLRIDLVSSDPHAHDAEYLISEGPDSPRRPEPRQILFQGSLGRCSDFVRGYLHGSDTAVDKVNAVLGSSVVHTYIDRPGEYDPPTPIEMEEHIRRSNERRHKLVTFRGSVSDLVTDLSPTQRAELLAILMEKSQ
jgi:hypothetical protein